MKIVNLHPDRATAGWFVSKLPPTVRPVIPGLTGSFFVKATFRLQSDGPPIAWEKGPEFASGDIPMAGDPAQGIAYASDFIPYKPRADFTAVGTACPPPGAALGSYLVRMRVGAMTKSILAIGNRSWSRSLLGERPGPPATAEKIPLTYARAWGGPEDSSNPLGCGRVGHALPNLERPGALVEGRNTRIEPAGFAPILPSWVQRHSRLGTYDDAWLAERWPWLPNDFDFSYFNAAPPDQWWNGYFKGDEEIEMQNMHPAHAIYRSRLPGLRARCFIEQTVETKPVFREVPLDLDTLWLDMNEEKLILVWRGRAPIQSIKLLDIVHLMALLEPLDAPAADLSHYHGQMQAALAPPPRSQPAATPGPPVAKIVADAEAKFAEQLKKLEAHESEIARRKAEAMAVKAAQGAGPFGARTPPQTNPLDAGLTALLAALRRAPKENAAGIEALAPRVPKMEAALQEAMQMPAMLRRMKEEHLASLPASQRGTQPPLAAKDIDPEAVRKDGFGEANLRGADFSGLDLSGVSFVGAVLTGSKFVGTKLMRANFRSANLAGADLSGADLTEASLDGADLTGCVAKDAIWTRASLAGTKLRRLALAGADFSGTHGEYADFSGTDLTRARFIEADLPRSVFNGAHAKGADFTRAKLANAYFGTAQAEGICMMEADLTGFRASRGADFRRGNFQRAFGQGSIWKTALLDEADFRQVRLPRAQFTEASLRKTNFDRAEIIQAVFEDAKLEHAILTNANLLRNVFNRANLTGASLDGSNLYESGFWETLLHGATWHRANIKRTMLAT